MRTNPKTDCPSKEKKACIYVYTAQVRSSDVKRDIEACRKLAEERGFIIVKTEIDGGRGVRDGLKRVLRGAKAGDFGSLIIRGLGRFGRHASDIIAVLVQLKMYKVNLLTTEGGATDLESAGFDFLANQQASLETGEAAESRLAEAE